MRTLLRLAPSLAVVAASALLVAGGERPAAACGGCFHEPPQGPEIDSVVTDHRMVFALSHTQTVLWDQIRYSGDPKRFAWVLPVRPGAHIELSHDAFIAALDASTQTVVTGPQRTCANGATRSYGSGGGGCGASSTSLASADAPPISAEDAGFAGNDQVTVVSQSVVGPYETVTVRSASGEALDAWLVANGFAVPPSIQPTIDAYAAEGFDFIALKLEPNAGIRAMQPVRVVTQGADPSLPLRMVAAGIGTHVGLSLYVISEGRYHPQNFPDVEVRADQITWDATKARSNYQDLAMAALQSGSGRGWLTEYAGPPSLVRSGVNVPTFGANNPGLADAYYGLCATQPNVPVPCVASDGGAGTDAAAGLDAASSDASGGDAGDADSPDATPDAAAHDAGRGGGGGCFTTRPACDSFDDLDIATRGLHRSDIYLTRLRAFLPADALAEGDLRLAAAPLQTSVSSVHHTDHFSDPSFDPCAGAGGVRSGSSRGSSGSAGLGCLCATTPAESSGPGRVFLLVAGGVFAVMLVRRRRRSA